MSRIAFLSRLRQDTRGAAIVEFALIAPIFLAMMFGVLQMGLQMQNYNAIRSIAADAARYTVVKYQQENAVDIVNIRNTTEAMAVNAPYLLDSDRLTVEVVQQPTSRVTDADEFTITLSYDPVNLLGFIDIDALTVSYSRPVFVTGAV